MSKSYYYSPVWYFLEPYVKRIQVPSEFFWRTKFFPTSWTDVFSQVWRRSIFKFCVYKLAEAVRYLKFKWEFVIIGRGCLFVLKFKSSLCWRMLCFKALKRLCSFGIKLPCVNPTFLRADSQWIMISSKHSNSLPIPYISLISTWDCYAFFEAWCD